MFKKVLGLRHWNNNVVKIPPPAAESGANASDVVVGILLSLMSGYCVKKF